MCLNLVLAQRRRETKGKGGEAARAKTAGGDGLLCPLMGTRAAGSVKAALILQAEKKNITTQKGTSHTEPVTEMNLKGEKKCAVFLVFSPNHINLTH